MVRGEDTSYNFAYQLGGGLSYALTEWATISLGYRIIIRSEIQHMGHRKRRRPPAQVVFR